MEPSNAGMMSTAWPHTCYRMGNASASWSATGFKNSYLPHETILQMT